MDDFLRQVSHDVRSGKRRRASVRTLLKEAGFRRRGTEVVKFVRQKLRKHGLKTNPDFADADMDAQVSFEAVGSAAKPKTGPSSGDEPSYTVGSVALKPLSSGERELTWQSGYRLLFRDFPTYVEGLKRLQSDGRVTVSGRGQNRFRQDREEFAFFIAIDRKHLGRDLSSAEQDYLKGIVSALASARAQELTDSAPPPNAVQQTDFTELESRLTSRLGEGLSDVREALESALSGLRQELQAKVEELRHDSIRKLAALQNADEFGKIIEEEHARYALELEKRDELVREHEEEIIRLAAQVEELEADLTQGLMDFDPGDALSTMETTVRLFAAVAGKSPVQVLPSAFDSARRSACKRRLEVFHLLLALRDLADALYLRGEQTGPLKDWFAARGYEYALKDSESTTGKHGSEREVLVDGERVLFEEHVTLFPNTPDCTQVYFKRDLERRVVIGYVGNHLRITSR